MCFVPIPPVLSILKSRALRVDARDRSKDPSLWDTDTQDFSLSRTKQEPATTRPTTAAHPFEQTQQQQTMPSQTEPTYHGSCLCGLSTYTLTAPPTKSIICHCTSCRKWSGSVFAANLFFPLSSLTPCATQKQKRFLDSRGQSGNELRRTFCGACGSSLYTEAPWAGVVSVARGTVDLDEEGSVLPEPEVEFWCLRKEGWVDVKGIKERFQRND